MTNQLQFNSIIQESDITKRVPTEQPEVVTDPQASTDATPLSKSADLYHNKLFTVVPIELDYKKLGIFPEDQGFSKKHVFLWDDYRDLITFPESKWRKIAISVPKDVKHTTLTRIPGNAYALPHIPNTWLMEEQKSTPQYVE